MLAPRFAAFRLVCLSFLAAPLLYGLQVTGYQSDVHDRFASGFPVEPVPNETGLFLGDAYDWTAVGWSTTGYVSGTHKNLALLSPRHFLSAAHYEHNAAQLQQTTGVRRLEPDGSLAERSVEGIANTGHGIFLTNQGISAYDLAVGALTEAFATTGTFTRLAVYDRHTASGSDALSAYNGLSLFLTGRGPSSTSSPRIGPATVDLAGLNGGDPNQVLIRTNWSSVQLEGGDSASPALHPWENPNGEPELLLLGVNSAIDATNGFNFISLLPTAGAIAATQAILNPDGFVLRVAGDPSDTWAGSASQILSNNRAWVSGPSVPAPSDRFALFDAAVAASRAVSVSSDFTLRGLYFKATSAADPFTFSGAATLTIGRGGLVNYDHDRQVFSLPLRLGSPQFWEGGPGGLQLQSIDTNGHLLELRSPGETIISGQVSGSGALALESGRVRLQGTHSYTGNTWVHGGVLELDGSIAASNELILGVTGRVTGTGTLPPLSGRGAIDTVDAVLLAPDLNPGDGLQLTARFGQTGAPDFGNASSSGNGLLRLTGVEPLAAALNETNRLGFYLDADLLATGATFRGLLFVAEDVALDTLLAGAVMEIYQTDPGGAESYGGEAYNLLSPLYVGRIHTPVQTADFGSGAVTGRIVQLELLAARYPAWVETLAAELPPEETLPLADPGANGVNNLMAWAFGLDPIDPDRTHLPVAEWEQEGETLEWILRYRRNRLATDLTYQIQRTNDLLAGWTVMDPQPDAVVTDPDPDGDGRYEGVEVRVPFDPQNPVFFRLELILDAG